MADVSVVAAEGHDGVLGHVMEGFDQLGDGQPAGKRSVDFGLVPAHCLAPLGMAVSSRQ
jgi:hypothetical protein